jgi:hypothetical protein
MGGKGSGGARVGAGRRRQTQQEQWIAGAVSRSPEQAGRKPTAALAPPEPVSRPLDLNDAEVDVWEDLAPQALANLTLTPATRFAFRDLVEAIVMRRAMRAAIGEELTVADDKGNEKAHPLITHHRGMMQRVEAGLARFRLAPFGKEILPQGDAPADPFADLLNDDAQTPAPTH